LEFPAIARLAKRRVLESALSAGVQRLAQRLLRLSGPDRPLPTVSVHALALALVETIASLPVYRTYVDASTPEPGGDDRRLLEQALADARIRGRAASEALDLLATALLALDSPMRLPANEGLRLRFVQRFQQLSGPATAKGIEDTAFYSYAPLLSRNEVGGSPEVPLDLSVDELHANNGHRAQCWPHAVLAVTTHDTKRSADVRSRLDVLSQIPEEWAAAVDRWRGWCRAHKRDLRGQRAPDPNTVYQVLQAIVGIWPSGGGIPDRACLESLRQRMVEYAIKAAREAKLRTSWTDPDADFEAALQSYVEALFDPERSAEFLQDLSAFVRRIAPAGLWNSLSRTLLHVASPGVPDLYQGDELWNLALVDPDNRRPVDFERRALALTEVEKRFAGGADSRHQFIAEIMAEAEDGRVKLHLIRAVLHARRQYPDLFRSRNYEPLRAAGPAASHVVGFGRRSGASRLIVLAPRLLALRVLDGQPPTAPAIWQDTVVRLPAGFPSQWRCVLSGEAFQADSDGALPVPEAFRWLPVALLLS
jgi:(1->4)-alpha-D-glucan 1-alpha-D-glucosylmutase